MRALLLAVAAVALFATAAAGLMSGGNERGDMEHAVIFHLVFDRADTKMIYELEDKLTEAINQNGVGEFDGDEFGDDDCRLYMYGPDADRLFGVIEPILRSTVFRPGSFAIKRYGGPQDPDVRQVRIDLAALGAKGG